MGPCVHMEKARGVFPPSGFIMRSEFGDTHLKRPMSCFWRLIIQLPDTAAWFSASKTVLPVAYALPSITRIGNRTFRKFCVGSEQSLFSRCKNFRRVSALCLLSPRSISALATVEWLRPIVKSGRGVLIAPSCLDWGKATGGEAVGGGIDDSDASGVGIDRSPSFRLLGRSTVLSTVCTWPKAFRSQTPCWNSGLRLGFQSDQD